MEGCFAFQWGVGLFFRWGASFLSGGCGFEKIVGWGGFHCVKEIVSVIKFELKTTTKNSCTFLLKSLECINSRDESPINSIKIT